MLYEKGEKRIKMWNAKGIGYQTYHTRHSHIFIYIYYSFFYFPLGGSIHFVGISYDPLDFFFSLSPISFCCWFFDYFFFFCESNNWCLNMYGLVIVWGRFEIKKKKKEMNQRQYKHTHIIRISGMNDVHGTSKSRIESSRVFLSLELLNINRIIVTFIYMDIKYDPP